jgi:DNA-binding phage protein
MCRQIDEVIMTSRNVKVTHMAQLVDTDVASEYLKEALESGDKRVIQLALRNIANAYAVDIAQCAVGREYGGPDCEYS